MAHATMNMNGETFVLAPQGEYSRLVERDLPPLPEVDEEGNYPALEAMIAVTARDIIEQRTAAGVTQKDLAAMAGIRAETLNKIEKCKVTPDTRTLTKIDAALKRAAKPANGVVSLGARRSKNLTVADRTAKASPGLSVGRRR